VGRLLTFRQLRTEKGWPHSRQWTGKLVKERKIPAPRKRPGGSINVWDETEWDAFQHSFVSAFPLPIQLALTAALIEALASASIDGVMAAVGQMRAVLEQEGATAGDVVVTLKASLASTTEAASEVTAATTIIDTS